MDKELQQQAVHNNLEVNFKELENSSQNMANITAEIRQLTFEIQKASRTKNILCVLIMQRRLAEQIKLLDEYNSRFMNQIEWVAKLILRQQNLEGSENNAL